MRPTSLTFTILVLIVMALVLVIELFSYLAK
jgi:hypothetical protein